MQNAAITSAVSGTNCQCFFMACERCLTFSSVSRRLPPTSVIFLRGEGRRSAASLPAGATANEKPGRTPRRGVPTCGCGRRMKSRKDAAARRPYLWVWPANEKPQGRRSAASLPVGVTANEKPGRTPQRGVPTCGCGRLGRLKGRPVGGGDLGEQGVEPEGGGQFFSSGRKRFWG